VKSNKKIYTLFHKTSAILLVLTLIWLTISTPFIISFYQELAKQHKMANSISALNGNEEETSNPLSNNTEEKAPNSGNSFSEEYLHIQHITHPDFSKISQYHKWENADIYIAFHGELIVPPPNLL
jgi:hypothetical protein